MKKAALTALTMFLVALAFVACAKHDDGNSAATPAQPCNIPGYSNCNPGVFQADPQLTPYQPGYANGYCGCPVGSRPIMNASWGISCAPYGWFQGSSYYNGSNYYGPSSYDSSYYGGGYYNPGYGASVSASFYYPQNNQWTSIPQTTYSPGISGNVGNCSATAACDTRTNDPISGVNPACGSTGSCRQTGGGSYIGVCTYGTGIDSYSNRQPYCYYRSFGGNLVLACGGTYSNFNTLLPR